MSGPVLPILPSATDIVSAFVTGVQGARPESIPHFNNGDRWADLSAMLRAQILLNLTRLGDEVSSARLKSAKDLALRQLCASEFNTVLPTEPQSAVAQVTLKRPAPLVNNVPTPSIAPSGVIPRGTIFTKQAAPNAQPLPVQAAQYTLRTTQYVAKGQLIVGPFNLDASSPGAAANVPSFIQVNPSQALYAGAPATIPVANTSIQVAQPQQLFDSTFVTSSCVASGGSSGLTDAVLVAAAKAYAIGQFGATDGAILAGMLQQQSVRHFASFPAATGLPYAQVYAADESWASAPPWYGALAQMLAEVPWLGFGARVRFGQVVNQQIAIAPTIVLQSTDDLNYTDDIDTSVKQAAEDYFNTRPTWWLWKLSELQALISVADPRILQCSSVTVTDVATGNSFPEAVNTFGLTWSSTIVHPYLTDQNVRSTYLPPS